MPDLVLGEPAQPNGAFVVIINKHDSIPDALSALVQNHVRVYRMAAQEANP